MKHLILMIAVAAIFASCNNIPGTETNKTDKVISDAISGATNLTGSGEITLKDVDASVVLDSLKKIGIYFVATVEKDRPRLRPISNINLHEGKIWFFVDKQKGTYNQLRNNPNIEIASTNGVGGKFIRVYGQAVLEDNPELIKKISEENPYFEQSGYKIGLFYISNVIAELPSSTGPQYVKF